MKAHEGFRVVCTNHTFDHLQLRVNAPGIHPEVLSVGRRYRMRGWRREGFWYRHIRRHAHTEWRLLVTSRPDQPNKQLIVRYRHITSCVRVFRLTAQTPWQELDEVVDGGEVSDRMRLDPSKYVEFDDIRLEGEPDER